MTSRTGHDPERVLAHLSRRDDLPHGPGDTRTCRHCGHPLALVPDVGWVVEEPVGSYDLCEADPMGNHDPAPA